MSEMDAELLAEYQRNVEEFRVMIANQARHREEVPNCGAAPMCIGPIGTVGLGLTVMADAQYAISMLRTAVGEIGRLTRKVTEQAQRLEAQRAVSDGLTKQLDTERRARAIEHERLIGEARTLESERDAALAELAVWEEAAEVLGPVALPED